MRKNIIVFSTLFLLSAVIAFAEVPSVLIRPVSHFVTAGESFGIVLSVQNPDAYVYGLHISVVDPKGNHSTLSPKVKWLTSSLSYFPEQPQWPFTPLREWQRVYEQEVPLGAYSGMYRVSVTLAGRRVSDVYAEFPVYVASPRTPGAAPEEGWVGIKDTWLASDGILEVIGNFPETSHLTVVDSNVLPAHRSVTIPSGQLTDLNGTALYEGEHSITLCYPDGTVYTDKFCASR